MKHVAAYRQLKPIYDRYQASKDKEKFLRGYEREIILFEAAAREGKRLGAVPLPSAERMQTEMDALTARRAALTAERQKARREEQDYAAVRRNVEEFLSPPRQASAALLYCIFRSACVKNGELDHLWLWILCGLPFGIWRLRLWIIPGGSSLGSGIALFALNFIIGGVISGFVLVWRLIVAVCYVPLTVYRLIASQL